MEERDDLERGGVTRRDFLKISGLTTGGMVLGSLSHPPPSFGKEAFPASNISCIIPSKPGGSRDLFVRAMAPYISKYLKEVSPGARGGGIQIRNEAAGAGQRGYSLMFNAKPDGYSLGAIETSAITDNIIEKPQFDFTKLTFLLLSYYSTKMIVTPKKGFNSWDEVASAMKKGPVKMSVASFGRSNHIAGIIMNEKAGTNLRIINFPGEVEAVNALIRGDTPLGLMTEGGAAGLLDAGEVRVLLELTRGTDYPGAVSLKEIGFPDLADSMNNSNYIIAPPNLPEEPKNILIEAMKRAANDKEFEAWAKKAKFNLGKTYGKDAEEKYRAMSQYFENIAPILLKHLK